MQKFNVSVPKKYMKDGVEKTQWNNVGKLIKFDATQDKPEGFVLELHMFPDTKFGVFEDKPREEKKVSDPADIAKVEYPEEEVNADDIPF